MPDDARDAARRYVGFIATGMPYIERGQTIPMPVVNDIRKGLFGDAEEAALILGALKTIDVALKRLSAKRSQPLPTVAKRVARTLRAIKGEDRLDVGPDAYDGALVLARSITNAQVAQAQYGPGQDFDSTAEFMMAGLALAVALILDLAAAFKMPASETAKRLALELGEVPNR